MVRVSVLEPGEERRHGGQPVTGSKRSVPLTHSMAQTPSRDEL